MALELGFLAVPGMVFLFTSSPSLRQASRKWLRQSTSKYTRPYVVAGKTLGDCL